MQRLIRQFLNFVVVGGISTLIDFSIFYILTEQMMINYMITTPIAFIIATVFNYWASMKYTFTSRFKEKDRRIEFMIFIILSVSGAVLTQFFMTLAVEQFMLEPMIAKVFVTALIMVYNFISRKLMLDSKKPSEEEDHA